MKIEIFCDGAVRSEGKYSYPASACAFVMYKNGRFIYAANRLLVDVSSNEAEYEAIITALFTCIAMEYKNPIIYTDSNTAFEQITGKSACKSPKLVPLLFTIKKIKQHFAFTIIKVPRSEVHEADTLCNEILDEFQGITPSEDLDL
jgi:ribonuclease HI